MTLSTQPRPPDSPVVADRSQGGQGYESISPYASMYDDPIRYSDLLGDEAGEGGACCGGLFKQILGGAAGVAVGILDNTLGSDIRGSISSSISDFKIAQDGILG